MDKWIFAVAVTLAVIQVASSDTLKPTGRCQNACKERGKVDQLVMGCLPPPYYLRCLGLSLSKVEMCPGPGERLSEELQRCIVPEQEENELEGPLDDDIGITEPTPLEEEESNDSYDDDNDDNDTLGELA